MSRRVDRFLGRWYDTHPIHIGADMRTNIVLDDKLVARVMKLAGARTKREAIHVAMREFVRSRSRPDVREIYGIGGLDPSYDHKKLRAGS
jgi:hypothetical protein